MHRLLSSALTAVLFSSSFAETSAHNAGCTVDHQPARIIRSVVPEYPAIAKLQERTGISVIRVDLSETGTVVNSSVAVSSGNSVLDKAAIQTARSMLYAPETRACNAISGSYAVQVDFAN